MRANLVKSETLPIFVMANSENVGSRITYKPHNKAGSLSDDLVPTSSRCLPKQPRGLASFVTYATNFFPKMANSEKVSAGAQGASIATVSARNSAFSKLVQAHSTKRYYQVSIYAKRIDICVANLIALIRSSQLPARKLSAWLAHVSKSAGRSISSWPRTSFANL